MMIHSKKISIIITAAGSSTRIGGNIKKEYLPYNNGTVLSSCAKNFLKAILENHLELDHFVITTPCGGEEKAVQALQKDLELLSILKTSFNSSVNFFEFVEGAETRQKSIFNALKKINSQNGTDIVLIHDGARPFISKELILNVINGSFEFDACVPGIPSIDTVKQIDEEGNIILHLKRNSLLCVQTPQGFNFNKLFSAHLKALSDSYEYTDDTEIYGKYVGKVKSIAGDSENIKITFAQDLIKLQN